MMFYLVLISFLLNFVGGNELNVNIEHGDNNTFIFYYNLTTNYSYYLTFRLFEHEQMKFGLFSPLDHEHIFQISNQYDTPTTLVYLFIVCFHFIRQSNDIDIKCKDLRLLKIGQTKHHLASYKPLFVPLMYALSVLMLLPVIIQHRRRKQAKLLQRQKELRRLSITIAQDNPSILPNIDSNGNINFKKIPIQIELVSLPSSKTIIDEIDDNDNVTYTLQKLQTYIDENIDDDDDRCSVTADDCIAHLINSAPWNSFSTAQPSREAYSMDVFEEQDTPMITTFYGDEDNQQTKLKSNAHSTVDLFRTNPAFTESDV